MNITINTSLDELLQLWVKHSKDLIEQRDYKENGFEDLKIINKILGRKGISEIMIEQVKSLSYTISYSYKGGRIKKSIPAN